MRNITIKKRSGSTFIIVIGILGVILFAASLFISATMESGRQTSMSLRGLHASSLAEASMERAMRIITQGVNYIGPDSTADDLGIILRLPATEGSSNFGLSDNFGKDNQLILPSDMKKEVILTEKELQPGNDKELDQLVEFLTNNSHDNYSVDVKVSISKAFRNSPGKDYPDFLVPGVDIGWNMRYDVESFLNGEGYTALNLEIPESWRWLDLSIPVKVAGIELVNINLTPILAVIPLPDSFCQKCHINDLSDLTSLHHLADILLNNIIGKGEKVIYPKKIKMDELKMPLSVKELWPEGVTVNEEDGQYLEKYGQIKFECEATINYKDGYSSTRRVSAVKDFKVADCEPPAPMYSLFVNNLANQYVFFNNLGGQFTVNNFDYSGFLGKIKGIFTKNKDYDSSQLENKEIPGLIRVNYTDPTKSDDFDGVLPLVCNVSLFGDASKNITPIEGDSGGILKLFSGMEAAMIVQSKTEMTILPNTEKVIDASVTVKKPGSNDKVKLNFSKGDDDNAPGANSGKESRLDNLNKIKEKRQKDDKNYKVPMKMKLAALKKDAVSIGTKEDFLRSKEAKKTTAMPNKEKQPEKVKSFKEKAKEAVAKRLKSALGNGINLAPDIGNLSVNIIQLTATLVLKPMTETILGAATEMATEQIQEKSQNKDVRWDNFNNFSSIATFKDCFESWEMPYMGIGFRFYTLPSSGTGTNKSHLFGYAGLHPTLTREIEGNVMKAYRQWNMCIVGLSPLDRLPLLPFPPVFLPPIPIPVWKTGIILNKYAYNFSTFKAIDDDGRSDSDVHEYDPEELENMSPNLYTIEQYAKKATYYYAKQEDFIEDLPNRMTKTEDGKNVLVLNGVTYIADSLGSNNEPFKVLNDDTLYVTGKGMIVCSGNIYLDTNIVMLDRNEDEHTLFSLMARNGGLIIDHSDKQLRLEGSLYTDYGIYLHPKSSLHIVGNWVTNDFNKGAMGGTVVVDYVSTKVRTSLGSLHPTRGKYEPKRYHVSFGPVWNSWRSY